MTNPDFVSFPKIARLRREVVITEKIDGTNASVTVLENNVVLAASRNKWITPTDDNAGFAKWVKAHEEELRVGLGFGTHFGEWWGQGIQRGYDLKEKRFSLFNTGRWDAKTKPACCHVVPVLAEGVFHELLVEAALDELRLNGSVAAPGFRKPEGIVVFHTASSTLYKVTLEKDEAPKGAT